MNPVTVPDEARARETDAYLEQLREASRASARRMLLEGADESEVAASVASFEPSPPDALETEPEPHDEERALAVDEPGEVRGSAAAPAH